MRLRGPVRVKNPDKVQPVYNEMESATLAMAGAMQALLNSSAMRTEERAPVQFMIETAREKVAESYASRLNPEASNWPTDVDQITED